MKKLSRTSLVLLTLSTCLLSCSQKVAEPETRYSATPLATSQTNSSEQAPISYTPVKPSAIHDLSPREKYQLAIRYLRLEDQANYKRAITLLENAAQHGIEDAAWELAQIYENGIAADADVLKALDWYQVHHKIADKKIPMGGQAFDENGNPISTEDMLKKIETLAQQGDVAMQAQLAVAYNRVKGHKNPSKSLHWYESAAKQGNHNAMLMTGYFYCRGVGTQPSLEKANYWLNQFKPTLTCK